MKIHRTLLALASLLGPAAAQVDRQDPVEVSVMFFVNDVLSIRESEEAIGIDFIMWLTWQDPSLTHRGDGLVVRDLNEVWHPELVIRNDLGLVKGRQTETVDVLPDGTVIFRQRYTGQIGQLLDLSDFPVDHQTLAVHVVSPSRGQVSFVQDPTTGTSESFSVQNWNIGQGTLRNEPTVIQGETYPGFVFELPAERYSSFHVWKVIIPLILVVLMSWSVFWITPAQMGPRLGIAATSILTLIAYRFVLERSMPDLSYLTRMDQFMIGSSLLVFLALVDVIVGSNLVDRGKEDLAKRLERLGRWIFPLALGGVIAASFWL